MPATTISKADAAELAKPRAGSRRVAADGQGVVPASLSEPVPSR
jgi:hypothetical protein